MREISGNAYVFWAEGECTGKIISSRTCRGHCTGEDVFELLGISEYDKADMLFRLDEQLVSEPIYYHNENVEVEFSRLFSNSTLLCLAVEQTECLESFPFKKAASMSDFQNKACGKGDSIAWCESVCDPLIDAPIMYGSFGSECDAVARNVPEFDENKVVEALTHAAELVGLELEYGIFPMNVHDNDMRSVFLPELCFAVMLILMMTAREFSFDRKLSAEIIHCCDAVKIKVRLDNLNELSEEYNDNLGIIASAFGASIHAETHDGVNIYEFIPYSIDEGQAEVKTDPLKWNYN